MSEPFDIQSYMTHGVERVVGDISPYSDINVRDTSLREALKSPLFIALQNGGLLNDDHEGGCVLYEKRTQVEALLSKQT